MHRTKARAWKRPLVALAAAGAVSMAAHHAAAQAGAPAPQAPVVVAPAAPAAPAAVQSSVPAPAELVAPAPVVIVPAPVAAPALPAVPEVQLTQPVVVAAQESPARLDYSDGSFYLRSVNDNIVFVPGARMHIDTYGFAGPGVADYHKGNGSGLKTNLFFRRFVIEMGGMIRKQWFFWIGGNFAPTQIDDSLKPVSTANVYDGFVGYLPTPRIRIYAGQYNAPFTMENVTSSRWLDLMERSLMVRTVATPYNKAEGFMVWGETEHKHFEYQAGVFGGDGMNRPNMDNRVDGMVRLVGRPLATRTDALKRLHVGAGGRLGWRDKDFTRYDAPGLSTPGGYTFWSPTYKTEAGDTVHVVEQGRQAAFSAELYVPFERWDFKGEYIYANEGRHEIVDVAKGGGIRSGKFSGQGGYAQLSFWLHGTPRINGNPAGVYGVTKLPTDLGAQAPNGLQLVLRAEFMRMNYESNANAGAVGGKDAHSSNIDVNGFQAGLNYWATKHVRLTGQYSLYDFPGSSNSNEAVAPGVASKKATDANVLHEFSVRVGLAL